MIDKKYRRAMTVGAIVGGIDGAWIYWSNGSLGLFIAGNICSGIIPPIIFGMVVGITIGYLGLKWVLS